MPNYFFRKNSIIKFYHIININDFSSITEERQSELDEIVNTWKEHFISNSVGILTLMTYTSERLTTSSKKFGLNTKEELAYFYINIVDPVLLFLEIYESASKSDEIKNNCIKNFYFYDKFLIQLEKKYNDYFKKYNPEDLWSRELVKKY